MKKITYLLALVVFGIGCDIIKKPVALEEEIIYEGGYCDTTQLNPIYSDTITSSSTANLRKILLEDYTGSACGNCPAAAVVVHDMATKYGDQIIAMGVHANFFADISIHTDFHTDYTTPAGEEYFTSFKILTNPKGMVNRTDYNSKVVLGTDQWDLAIQAVKDIQSIADLNITNIYNSKRRISYLDVNVKFTASSTAKYKVIAHLLEDGIIDKQANYETGGDPNYASPKEEKYPHSHVLRATYDNTWGKEVNTTDVNAGDEFTISFDKFCVEEHFIDTNCDIIVYIYDDATKEVLQVEKLHLRK